MRKLQYGVYLTLLLVRRYLVLGYQIMRTEGLSRLLERIGDKLFPGRQHLQSGQKSDYKIAAAWEPLVFPRFENPRVSVVIPVHNAHLYTFTCLKSIASDGDAIPFEVIVVDDHSDDETPRMLSAMSGLRVVRNEGERGFVYACNLGAQNAHGDYLVFLNNDTIVPSGWLKTIIATFAENPDIGLVGVKLLYPTGRLQEAGGIIWKDGSAWNYGRGDDPNKPQYNYLREVDYCSGACLAISRQLFLDLGSFSETFAPAYLEDADLAFKVRQSGRRVVYQPAVAVIHFEGISSGTHILSGLKQYQLINQTRFAQLWNNQLSTHRTNGYLPDLEKDRGADKRMLVIDAYLPMPDRDSGSLRMAYLLVIFQELGYKVTFAAANLQFRVPYGLQLQQQGIEVLYSPYVTSIKDYLKANGACLDVVWLCRANVAENFLATARACAPAALLIFDTIDLHFLREQRMADKERSRALAKIAALRKEQELDLMRKADINLVVSTVEKALITELDPRLRVAVLSNIHVVYGSATDYSQREGILFIGSFNHPPNTDAVLYYAREIRPLVQRELGDVKTYIIGDKPPPQVLALASETLVITGHVPDVARYFSRCRLSIAPLRYGAGVKGKVNLSMAYGVPVVATPIAIEGMALTHGEDVIVGEDAVSFAAGIAKVYRDQVLWTRLSDNGLTNVEKYFSRRVAVKTLDRLLHEGGLPPKQT